MIEFSVSHRPEFEEYVDFLKRTDLGSQYPKQNFENRIRTVLRNIDICVTARSELGQLVGICFGLTDHAYFLFLTDLGVDRRYLRHGIGRRMLEMAVEEAGGLDDITVTTISNNNALEFYAACGLDNKRELVVRYCREWESFVVG